MCGPWKKRETFESPLFVYLAIYFYQYGLMIFVLYLGIKQYAINFLASVSSGLGQ